MHRLDFAVALPPKWRTEQIGNISELVSRGRSPQYVEDSPIKVIGQRCVRNAFDSFAARSQNQIYLDKHLKVLSGDVLVNSTGTGTIGRVCVFPGGDNFIVDSHVTVIRPIESDVHPRWLEAVLRSAQGQKHLENYCFAGSTNQVELARTPLIHTAIPLPPLPEQRRIAEILDTLDAVIERTEALVQKLKLARAGLLHDLLTRGLDEQGQLRDPERNPEQFKDSELGRVPVGWSMHTVREIADTYAGGTPERQKLTNFGGDIPWVKSGEVNRTDISSTEETITQLGMLSSSAKWILPGTTLVAMYGATAGTVSWLQIKATSNQAVLAVRPKEPNVLGRWLYWLLTLRTPGLLVALQGSGQLNLSKGGIDKIKLAVPMSLTEQTKISVFIDTHAVQIRKEQIQLDKLRQLKRGLMEDLLTGRVRVPIAELASEVVPPVRASQTVPMDLPAMPPPQAAQSSPASVLYRAPTGSRPEAKASWAKPTKPLEVKDLLVQQVHVPTAEQMPETATTSRTLSPNPLAPPPAQLAKPAAAHVLYRAAAGSSPEARSEWTAQLEALARTQRVEPYSPEELDAMLPELLEATAERGGLLRVPELLARAGIRLVVLPHSKGSRTSGAAFYLDAERTQPVVGLSLRLAYLDVFWFNLLHELAHIRLGHAPVDDESLDAERGEYDRYSPDEQAANAWAQEHLIPARFWTPFSMGKPTEQHVIKRFATRLGRHPSIVAGRLAFETGQWALFNSPKLRPIVKPELTQLMERVGQQ